MDSSDRAAELFEQGYSCAQSVIMACAESDLPAETAARLSATLGGGMSRTGRTCGAVSGALLALGLRTANPDPSDKVSKERVYALARQLLDDFSARHGSTDCPGLLGGCHIGTPEGADEARAKGYFKSLCPMYVRDAAQLVEDIAGA